MQKNSVGVRKNFFHDYNGLNRYCYAILERVYRIENRNLTNTVSRIVISLTYPPQSVPYSMVFRLQILLFYRIPMPFMFIYKRLKFLPDYIYEDIIAQLQTFLNKRDRWRAKLFYNTKLILLPLLMVLRLWFTRRSTPHLGIKAGIRYYRTMSSSITRYSRKNITSVYD